VSRLESTTGFLSGFMDDYFAECDDHLRAIRRALLALSGAAEQRQTDAAALDQLFRGFHSLKGLSGMVELRDAERLAHEMESYLRALQRAEAALTSDGVEGLIAGTRMLEKVIEARRDGQPAPAVEATLDRLAALVPERAAAGGAPPGTPPAERAAAAGLRTWRVRYAPTPELIARGVNVNVVRARLQEAGQIAQAAPHVTPGGGIAFEFIVTSALPETSLRAWEEDGLTVEPVPPPPDRPLTPASPAETVSGPATVSPSHFVRVDLTRLDDLMRIIGDIVIARARLADHLTRVERHVPAGEWRALQESGLAIERHLRDLREGVMRVRLVPIGEVFERMIFVVRDLAREQDKRVKLDLHGQATEIDKFLIERMMDPLLHLIRNAITHGLESTGERVAQGKPEESTLTLRASTAGDLVVIEVEDDGRGIDAGRVAERARALGHLAGDEAPEASSLLDLICAPGVSTSEEADRASGRGVGMAVVRNAVQAMGGTMAVETEQGRGTRFTLQLPLTLAITDALIATVGERTFAVPQGAVSEVIEVEPSAVRHLQNNEIVPYRGGVLPLLRLARLFGMPEGPRPRRYAFVVGRGAAAVGIVVDRIVGQREIVVRTFSDAFIKVEGVAGATELGDGRVVLILDVLALTRRGRERSVR
jgi:two-component system chemotaxis sensor kinase CheA